MKYNKKKGFTIVELVIVIAVIGILSAILIPTFVGVTQAAQDAATKSNLANAYSMYAADAADGKVGDDGDPLAFYAQDKIVLSSDKLTSTESKVSGYAYGANGWTVKAVDFDLDNTGVAAAKYKYVAGNGTGYNGYHVYVLNSAVAA